MRFLKEKALFMIFLIVLSGFSLINIQEVEAQQQGCCERTNEGEFCQYTDSSNCDPSFLSTPATCEASSFCELGCCFDSDSGECFKQTSKTECVEKEGTWENSPLCEIQQCQVGCCQLSNQGFISTLTKCKQVTSQYPNVEMQFDTSIQDEYSCVNSVRSGDLGCCVQAEGECGFTTREECGLEASQPEVDEEGNPIAGTQASESAFHAGILCSNDQLKCNAAKQQKLGCYNGDVFWFDSEGNSENVFLGHSSEEKARAYNGGRVLEEAGCEATPGDENCGNCDYVKGTLCGEENGEFSCQDLNCRETTQSNFGPDATGRAKDLGESWCVYDGIVGFGRDRVGSRHFRSACINGEEVIEPCRDFREEYCTQSYSNGEATSDVGSVYRTLTANLPSIFGESPLTNLFQGSGYSEAACSQNRYESCFDCNQFSNSQDVLECCNELSYRDCFFSPSGVTEKLGTCVPMVPPGLRFWSDSGSVLDRTTTGTDYDTIVDRAPSAPGDSECSKANIDCEVGFTRGGWDHVLGRSNWECTYNCHCLTEDFFAAAHSVCRSLGDCGSDLNWAGVVSIGGVDVKVNGPEGDDAVSDGTYAKIRARLIDDLFREARAKPPKEGGGPDKPGFSEFFKRTAVPGSLILISGLVGVGTTAGFFGGLLFGPAVGLGGLSSLATLITTGVTGTAQPLGTLLLGAQPVSAAQGAQAATFGGVQSVFPQQIAAGQVPASGFAMNSLPVNIAEGYEMTGAGSSFLVGEGGATLGIVKDATLEVTIDGVTETLPLIKGAEVELVQGADIVLKEGGMEFLGSATGEMTGVATGAEGLTSTGNALAGTFQWGPTLWGTIQVVAWIWTIYNVVDVFLADTMTGSGTFMCTSWEAPYGGSDCEKCNEGELPCSEYRCKALGKSCSLINEGSENEICVNSLPNDASSPRIDADTEAMRNLRIEELTNGFTLVERVPPFTPVTLAIETDEPAQCRFNTEPGIEYEEMNSDFGDNLFDFNHELTFNLPSELTTDEAITLTNGGQYTLYVRCNDANNNPNRRDYTIRFGIQKGPDVTAPQIGDTSIESGAFIAADIDSVSLNMFVSEPSQCKWDKRDVDYDLMGNTFSCAQGGQDLSFSGQYKCGTSLDIEKPNPDIVIDDERVTQGTKQNDFFFKCQDNKGNKNIQSTRFSLVSTIPLEITNKEPEGLIRTGEGIELKVTTANGAENGVAVCGYGLEDKPVTNIPQFSSTNSQRHSQILPAQPESDYKFFIKCIDKAGNLAEDVIEFSVERDVKAPDLLFVFKDTQLGVLTIRTDEAAQCEFGEADFPFGRGTPMASADKIAHEATLGSSIYVIKCQDFAEEANEATFMVVP